MRRRPGPALRALAVCALASVARTLPAQLPPIVPLGSEFQVNDCTLGSHEQPDVAMAPGGEFVVVWQGQCRAYGLFGRRFEPDGSPSDVDFQIARSARGVATSPRVAVTPSGHVFVVYDYRDGLQLSLRGQFFDEQGRRMGDEVDILQNGSSALVASGVESFVVIGLVEKTPGNSIPFARRYVTSGEFTTIDIERTASPAFVQSLATDPSGGFTVVFQGYSVGRWQLFGRRFTSSDTPVGGDIPIKTDAPYLNAAHAAAHRDGGFVVVWEGLDGSSSGVFGKRYDSQGTVLGTEFRVNENTAGSQSFARVVTDPSGGFTVIWSSDDQSLARRYSEAVVPISGEFPLGARADAVAADAAGRFVVTWSDGADLYSQTVRARRFALCNGVASDPEQCRTPVTPTPLIPRSTPTPAASSTGTATADAATSTPVRNTPTSMATETPTSVATGAVTITPPPPASATPHESETPETCAADCNADDTVAIDELMLAIGKALGETGADLCGAADPNADGRVAIEELVQAVSALVRGCNDLE